jgi:hypothetical protein
MSGDLEGVRDALSRVLTAGQVADLGREGASVFLDLGNTSTLHGVRIAVCPGCKACNEDGSRHLSFTPYTMQPRN